MGSISRAFALTEVGKLERATDALREEFKTLQNPTQTASVCEWIASCYSQIGNDEEAGNWYACAAELVYSDESVPSVKRAPLALHLYEMAMHYFEIIGSTSENKYRQAFTELSRKCIPV